MPLPVPNVLDAPSPRTHLQPRASKVARDQLPCVLPAKGIASPCAYAWSTNESDIASARPR
ncbi:hypothetical protein M2311_000236 [Rhizobium leguminosarum]|nr:hypothetical protein [Rhizobium leguminosarum]